MRSLATITRRLILAKTGRLFGTRKKEHHDEAERLGTKKFTRATRKDSKSKQTKSSIADHVANENHLLNWEESSILAKDSERNTRWIRESIWIRRKGGNNNTHECRRGALSTQSPLQSADPEGVIKKKMMSQCQDQDQLPVQFENTS